MCCNSNYKVLLDFKRTGSPIMSAMSAMSPITDVYKSLRLNTEHVPVPTFWNYYYY